MAKSVWFRLLKQLFFWHWQGVEIGGEEQKEGRMEVGLKKLEMLGGSVFLAGTSAGLAPEPAFIYSIVSFNLDDADAR